MIEANKYQDSDCDSPMDRLMDLFKIYNIPDDLQTMYLNKVDTDGCETVIEYVIRDLPDGFTRGRYLLKDLMKRLDHVDHSRHT